MQIYACAWIYHCTKSTVENQDWATEPAVRRAVASRGPRAVGPWRTVGRGPLGLRAAGPLGRGVPLGRGPAFSKTLSVVEIERNSIEATVSLLSYGSFWKIA